MEFNEAPTTSRSQEVVQTEEDILHSYLEEVDDRSRTPLHRAIEYDQTGIALVLIGFGANVNAKDVDNNTPLHYAIRKHNHQLLDALLFKGADLEIENNDNCTPLLFATRQCHYELSTSRQRATEGDSMFTKLVNSGANVNVKTVNSVGSSRSPFSYVLWLWKNDKIDLSRFTYIYRNVYIPGWDVFNLQTALKVFSQITTNFVMEKHKSGMTLLHMAVKYNAPTSVVKLLLQKGSEVNAQSEDGRTPLHMIDECDSFILTNIKTLLDWGASFVIKDGQGRRPLEVGSKHYTKLQRYVIMLEVANLPVHRRLHEFHLTQDDSFRTKCMDEMEKIKNTSFENDKLWHVFTKFADPPLTLIENQELEKYIGCENSFKGIRKYGKWLRIRYSQIKIRPALLDKTQRVLLSPLGLPCELVRMILSYLNNTDIKNLYLSYNS